MDAAVCEDEGAGNPEGAPGGAPSHSPRFDRARGTAKRLLALRREDMELWAAYAQLEAQAGNAKVKGLCKCLWGTALTAKRARHQICKALWCRRVLGR